jgi:hypothetical protein
MFPKLNARLIVFVAIAATLGGGLFLYVSPASTKVDPAPVFDRPSIANEVTIRPWGEDLSAAAVGSGGIELDLDGNVSALFASDQWCGLLACGNPRQP